VVSSDTGTREVVVPIILVVMAFLLIVFVYVALKRGWK